MATRPSTTWKPVLTIRSSSSVRAPNGLLHITFPCQRTRRTDSRSARTVISLHEHPVLWPEDMGESMEMKNLGRDFTAYEDLGTSRLRARTENGTNNFMV